MSNHCTDRALVRPLTVVSDGLPCFTVTESAGVRELIVTGGGKASVANPKFNAVNTAFSNLKTAISGAYHPSTSRNTLIAASPSSSTGSTGAPISV